ncbi:hypothetical protein MtrunA17_Chr6g0458841 [Medicago truncatula]|uniref:Uncharacterized protein n=1 Tax=Medicago truncatula TaxID=3880 RepID=A0A396HBG5_MEDTR|nr:hypothetical protein MtrunA17_Chr6g0458841 [Medicago truncatula]
METPKRVVFPCFLNCSTKSIKEFLSQFKYQSKSVLSLRKCVKKIEHEGTVEEDSSPLPPKISTDSRKRPKVEKPRKTEKKEATVLLYDEFKMTHKDFSVYVNLCLLIHRDWE